MTSAPPSRPAVVVIGAGAAGLAAAHRLGQAGVRVTVLEREGHAGGRMWTESVEGFDIDAGAGFLANFYSNTLQLVRELGLEAEIVPIRGNGAILRDGRVHQLHRGVRLASTRLISPRGKLTLLRALYPVLRHWAELDVHAFHRAHRLDTDSIAAYARRSLSEELLKYLIQPALGGILYWTPERTSQAMLFILLKAALGMHRLTLRRGVGALAEQMAAGVEVVLDAAVSSVRRAGASGYAVAARVNGQEARYEADGIVCTVPAPVVPTLFPDLDPRQRTFFNAIRYSSTVIAALALERPAFSGIESVLFPAAEPSSKYLATATSLATKNPHQLPAGRELLRLYASRAAGEALLESEDREIRDLLVGDLRRAGIATIGEAEELFCRIYRWRYALPEFDVGHFVRLKTFAEGGIESDGVRFAGDYLGGPFVEGAITSGQEAAGRLLEHFRRSRAGPSARSERDAAR